MGEVYLAQDTKLDRPVAIKFLNQEFSRDIDKLNRFIQEARAASALNHPNILTVYEIGEVDGQNYISTELIDGQTLREHLSQKEPLPLDTILKIGIQVAEALSAAHHAGIIHRDIKPENIMIRKDGYAKVLDFGLAKLAEPRAVATGSTGSEDATRAIVKTSPGIVMGTVSYMSPEQARGKETDARTDIWSLGIVLYEMLARKVPFTGETVNHTIVSILEREPTLLENVPGELQRIIRKAMTKDVEMRYQSARDLLIDLKNLRRDLDVQGEIERSVVPNRATATGLNESETRLYSPDSVGATRSGQAPPTQHVTSTTSSLEYAVTQAKSHKLATAIVGLVLLALISSVSYFAFLSSGSSNSQINSIAVLPFENRSGNPDSEYLSDGLAESLIYRLSQLPNLKVSPTSAVMRYKTKELDVQLIATELGVQAVMFGRMTQRGENLSISVELIDAANNKIIWGEQYERKMSDLLATQRQIATAITEKLQVTLSGEGAKGITKRYTENNEAYQLYLKGRFLWNKRTVESLKQAVEYYNQAIGKDPTFALAYSGLAETYVLFPNYDVASAKDSMPQAKAAAMRALALDDSLAEAHTALGWYLMSFEYDWPGGERELRRAIELNPKYATAHQWLGELLAQTKRFDEGQAETKLALEADPLSPVISFNVGWQLFLARRYDDALREFDRTATLYPDFALAATGICWGYYAKGALDHAIPTCRKARELMPDAFNTGYLSLVLGRAGQREEARKLLDELKNDSLRRDVPSIAFAFAHIGLDQKELAMAMLQKEVDERGYWASTFAVQPELDDFRSDPRFQALLRRMNLPQ